MFKVTQPLLRWIMQRYSIFWSEFDIKHSKAASVLHDDNMVSIVLPELRKSGWIEVKLSTEDLRKRRYRLKSLENAVLEISRNPGQKMAGLEETI